MLELTQTIISQVNRMGRVPSDQLTQLVSKAKNSADKFATMLIEEGYLSRNEIGNIIAGAYNIAYINLSTVIIVDEVLEYVDEEICAQMLCMPIYQIGKTVSFVANNPFDKKLKEYIENIYHRPISILFSFSDEILLNIAIQFNTIKKFKNALANIQEIKFLVGDVISEKKLKSIANSYEADQLIDILIKISMKLRANQVTIIPEGNTVRIKVHSASDVIDIAELTNEQFLVLSERIKLSCELNEIGIAASKEGSFKFKVASKTANIKITIFASDNHESIFLDFLSNMFDAENINLTDLGFTGSMLKRVSNSLLIKGSVFFVTGPRGSGKSKTVDAITNFIKTNNVKISTAKDLWGTTHENSNQQKFDALTSHQVFHALQTVLNYEDSNLLILEVNNVESAKIAAVAALKGHNVIVIVNSDNAVEAIRKFIEMGAELFIATSPMVAVLNQHLVRRICKKCIEYYRATDAELSSMFVNIPEDVTSLFYQGRGCSACFNTGYSGYIPIYEFLVMNSFLQKSIIMGDSYHELEKNASNSGFESVYHDGVVKALLGYTTLSEIMSIKDANVITCAH